MVLLRLFIADKQLTVLPVPMGLVAGRGDDVEGVGRVMEDLVHLFQGAIGGFREEEIDRWDHEEVDDCEDDVGPVADIGESWGGDPAYTC